MMEDKNRPHSCQRSPRRRRFPCRIPQSTEPQPAATAASATGRPPFRADHVGSLLRPPGLLRARDDAAAGRISGDELRAAEDTAIREVVRRQQEVGLAWTRTDGELRRESWHMDFIYQLGGVKKVQDDTIRVAFHNKQKDYERPRRRRTWSRR